MKARHCRIPAQLAVTFLALAALVSACATAPPARPVTDIASIAGKWKGQGMASWIGPNSGPIEMTIAPDGTVDGFLPALNPPTGTKFAAKMWVEAGRIRYETANSTGTVTLHEGSGKRQLNGSVTHKARPGTGWFELHPAN